VPPTVTFVGTGEAFDPELPNTSLLYRGDRTLLLDCGYSVPHAFWRISRDPSLLDAIYVTHLHADHSFGLPALLLWMREAGRTRPLTVFGGAGVDRWLDRLLELGYPGSYAPEKCYPIEPIAILPGQPRAFGACTLSNAPSRHVVRNLSLRIDEQGRGFCYSGDGAPSDETRELYRDAALLVHECYAASEAPAGHASAEEISSLAEQANVSELCLLHIGRAAKRDVQARVASYAGRVRVRIPAPGDVVAIV
jgi:ribonuclease BN (tRNA processing enzyme)